MDKEEKERLKGEAKVIIASRYFDMFRHFGGLPLVDHAFEVSNEENAYYTERATVDATVKFMTKLLDEAALVLPWAWILRTYLIGMVVLLLPPLEA
jgi:hypothetical protein